MRKGFAVVTLIDLTAGPAKQMDKIVLVKNLILGTQTGC